MINQQAAFTRTIASVKRVHNSICKQSTMLFWAFVNGNDENGSNMCKTVQKNLTCLLCNLQTHKRQIINLY